MNSRRMRSAGYVACTGQINIKFLYGNLKVYDCFADKNIDGNITETGFKKKKQGERERLD
jgi:hypothetical protein